MKKVILVMLLFLLLVGCTEEKFFDERVLGSWDETHNMIFTFDKEMKLTVYDGYEYLEYDYWFENETFVIDWKDDGTIGAYGVTVYDYEVRKAGSYEFFVLRIDNADRVLMSRLLE